MSRALAIAVALLALLPSPAAPLGEAPPAPAPVPEAAPEPAEPPASSLPGAVEVTAEPPAPDRALLEEPNGSFLDAWLDLPHAFIEKRIFGVVAGFDRFFADERDIGCLRSTSFMRLRNEARLTKDGKLEFGSSLRADLKLPYIQKRLQRFRILLEDAGRGLVESDPAAISGRPPGARADAVLGLTLLDTLRSSIDLGAGVLFDLPPGLVGRVRFRFARPLGRVALARTLATGFWNTRDGFGSNGSLAFERAIGRRLLLRWTSGTVITQRSLGFESASELALLATLGRTTGLTVLGAGASRSKPDFEVQNWRVAARLRTSLLRSWIFGEVEPEVNWPLDPAGGRRPVPAIIFRLEIQFEETQGSAGVAAGGSCGLASGKG